MCITRYHSPTLTSLQTASASCATPGSPVSPRDRDRDCACAWAFVCLRWAGWVHIDEYTVYRIPYPACRSATAYSSIRKITANCDARVAVIVYSLIFPGLPQRFPASLFIYFSVIQIFPRLIYSLLLSSLTASLRLCVCALGPQAGPRPTRRP
jgi:hypothetical protein